MACDFNVPSREQRLKILLKEISCQSECRSGNMRPMAPDDSLTTRRTLLSRLRNLEDQESWRTFFDRYWELLYNVARRSGLGEPEA